MFCLNFYEPVAIRPNDIVLILILYAIATMMRAMNEDQDYRRERVGKCIAAGFIPQGEFK